MKYYAVILAVALALSSALSQTTSSLDASINRMTAGTGNTAPPQLPLASVFSHGLVAHDGTLLLAAWNRAIVIPSRAPWSPSAYHSLAFTQPTAARGLVFPNAAGTINPLTVHTKTATGTLAVHEVYGGLITNTGASGAIVLTLPTPAVGMHFRVYLTAAQDVDLNAANATQILALTNATGDAISSAATVGNCIELLAVSETQWVALAVSGTWTDVN